MLRIKKTVLTIVISLIIGIAIPSTVLGSNVLINNSLSKDDEGSLLEVDSITTKEGVKARYRLRIYPGETKEVSSKDLLGFQISRVFDSHKLRYEITCTATRGFTPVTFNVSKIHEDKLGPECKLTGYGHWSRRTGLNWLMKKKTNLDKHKNRR